MRNHDKSTIIQHHFIDTASNLCGKLVNIHLFYELKIMRISDRIRIRIGARLQKLFTHAWTAVSLIRLSLAPVHIIVSFLLFYDDIFLILGEVEHASPLLLGWRNLKTQAALFRWVVCCTTTVQVWILLRAPKLNIKPPKVMQLPSQPPSEAVCCICSYYNQFSTNFTTNHTTQTY